jgi:hypothetical protein
MSSRTVAAQLVRELGAAPRTLLPETAPPRSPGLVKSILAAFLATPIGLGFLYGTTTAEGMVVVIPLLLGLLALAGGAAGWHGLYTWPRMRRSWRRAWERGTPVLGQVTSLTLLESNDPTETLHATYEIDGRPYKFVGQWPVRRYPTSLSALKPGDAVVILPDPEDLAYAMVFPADYPDVFVSPPEPESEPVEASGAVDTDSLAGVMAGLGIPVDMGITTPQNAFSGGLAKANLYMAFKHLRDGEFPQALEILEITLKQPLAPPVAAVAYLMRGRVYFMQQERSRAAADLALAAKACPEHPQDQTLGFLAATSRIEPPRPFYAPSLAGTTEVRRVALDAQHEGILRRHPPADQQTGVLYLYTLAVHPKDGGPAVLYVASEYNKSDRPEDPDREGSHFLGLFPGDGHVNLGLSDDWADLEKFAARAVEVARQRLAQG